MNHPEASVREEAWRRFEGLVDLALRLESPGVTILPGAVFDGVDESESLRLAAAELERRARHAGELGLRFSVEPHFRSVVPSPSRTAALMELTDNVGLTLDLSHFTFQVYGQAECDPLLPRTEHVHLRQAAPGLIQARVAEGTIHFPTLRDKLLEAGYENYFAIEFQWEEGWLDFTHVDCIAETAEMRDLMRS